MTSLHEPPERVTGTDSRCVTGVKGLDDVLGGGLPPRRMYLLKGNPGVGKTTLALQFLLEGARRGRGGALYHAFRNQRGIGDGGRRRTDGI
jgi:circadian clock protein KaiC